MFVQLSSFVIKQKLFRISTGCQKDRKTDRQTERQTDLRKKNILLQNSLTPISFMEWLYIYLNTVVGFCFIITLTTWVTLYLNDLEHSLQINGFSPEWVLKCVFRALEVVNDLEHSLQVHNFSPEWVLRWILISPDVVNDLDHSLQVNGFFPEWVLRWILRSPNVVNELEHSLQVNGFSPEFHNDYMTRLYM